MSEAVERIDPVEVEALARQVTRYQWTRIATVLRALSAANAQLERERDVAITELNKYSGAFAQATLQAEANRQAAKEFRDERDAAIRERDAMKGERDVAITFSKEGRTLDMKLVPVFKGGIVR